MRLQPNRARPLVVRDLAKRFTMHLQGGLSLPVLDGAAFSVAAGRCAVLAGPSGAGKSSIMKVIFGSYASSAGAVLVWHDGRVVDMAGADPRAVMAVRRHTIAYVSQFLRVVPRVSARDIVAAPLVERGVERGAALARAEGLLDRLNLPRRLHDLPPATFSGGEQQRVNIARGFITDHPILLLDEPTASLDEANRAVVLALMKAKKADGVAMLAIFHDADTRAQVADAVIDVAGFAPAAAA